LIGYSRISGSVSVNGASVEDSANAFMFQFGGGATVRLGSNFGVFGDLSYRRSFFDNATDEFQVYLGARFMFN
jgi:hypothetical protein